MKKRQGFTFMELMVVILILAILSAMILPKVIGRESDAKVAKAQSDISVLHGALQSFRLDCGRYPTTQEGLQALMSQPSNVKGWKKELDADRLSDDPWGHPYVYSSPGSNGRDFDLMSYGSDGVAGGDGDAADIIDGQ
jgi:general secretion pathway protein G